MLTKSMLKSKVPFTDCSNVFWHDENILLKIVPNGIEYWQAFQNKNIPFLNNPLKIEELDSSLKKEYSEPMCAIYIPFERDYFALNENRYTKEKSLLDQLKMFRQLFLKLQFMHDNNAFHGDLHSGNILINQDLDLKFIDLDLGIVDDIISIWYVYNEEKSLEEAKEKIRKEDKNQIIRMFCQFYYFSKGENDLSPFKNICISNDIAYELRKALAREIPIDYYLIDILDYLINNCASLQTLSRKR